jgi:Flp pilus assembly protein TadG
MNAKFVIQLGRRFCRSEDGATAVEMAIIITAFMLLIFGIVQFSQIFWAWNTMLLAIEEGGRYAMIYNAKNFPSGPPASSCSVATPTLANCAVAQANAVLAAYPSPSVTISCTAGPSDCTNVTSSIMTIQGTFTFDFVTPVLFPYGPLTLTSEYTVPLS